MKTIGRKLTATPNYYDRTFTIRITNADGSKIKYRTVTMNEDEFRSELNNTENDWFQFLKTDSYYKVN